MNLILTILYMVFVFVVSVIKTPGGVDPFIGFDKVIHFFIYGIMGLLLARVFLRRGSSSFRREQKKAFLAALVISFSFGLFIEVVQGFLPVREFSIFDALANGAGAGAGAFLYCLVQRYICQS